MRSTVKQSEETILRSSASSFCATHCVLWLLLWITAATVVQANAEKRRPRTDRSSWFTSVIRTHAILQSNGQMSCNHHDVSSTHSLPKKENYYFFYHFQFDRFFALYIHRPLALRANGQLLFVMILIGEKWRKTETKRTELCSRNKHLLKSHFTFRRGFPRNELMIRSISFTIKCNSKLNFVHWMPFVRTQDVDF